MRYELLTGVCCLVIFLNKQFMKDSSSAEQRLQHSDIRKKNNKRHCSGKHLTSIAMIWSNVMLSTTCSGVGKRIRYWQVGNRGHTLHDMAWRAWQWNHFSANVNVFCHTTYEWAFLQQCPYTIVLPITQNCFKYINSQPQISKTSVRRELFVNIFSVNRWPW